MEQMNVSESQGGSSNPEHILVNNTYKCPKILKPAACWGRWGSDPDSPVNKVWEFKGKKMYEAAGTTGNMQQTDTARGKHSKSHTGGRAG